MKHLTVQSLKLPYQWSANSSNILEADKLAMYVEKCTLFIYAASPDHAECEVCLRYCVDNDKLYSVENKIGDIVLENDHKSYEYDLSKMDWWKYNPFGFRLVFSRKGQKNIVFKELRLNYYGEQIK